MTETNRKGQDYCLLLGSEKFRHRSLLGTARVTDLPIAVMFPEADVNGHNFADLSISANHCHPQAALAALERHQALTGAKPKAIIPLIEMCMESGLAIAKAYDLAYLSEAAIGCARNKYEMRKAFEAAGLPVPKYRPFSNYEELRQQAGQLEFPVVLKPRNAGGSEGVVFVKTPSGLEGAFAHLQAAMTGYGRKYGLDESIFLVEEYVDAPFEASVLLATSKKGIVVLAVMDHYIGEKPYFVEVGHSLPSVFASSKVIRDTGIAACRALGIERGVVEVEMKVYDADRVCIMELNSRPPGDSVMDMIESASGVNCFEMHAKSYLQDDYEPRSFPLKGRAAIGFMNGTPGTVTGVRLPLSADLPDSVVSVQTWRKPGDVIVKSHDSNTRDGSVQFYWPDDPVDGLLAEHLKVSKELAGRIYSIR